MKPSDVRSSLATRLVLWVGVAAALTFSVFGSFALWRDYRLLAESRRAEGATVVELARGPLALAAWNLDERSLNLFVARLVEAGVIVGAEVRDTRGRTLAAARRGAVPAGDGVATASPLFAPDGVREIGELVIVESFAPVRAQLLRSALSGAAFDLLKLLIVALGLYWIVDRLVLRRLARLDEQVRALQPGDLQTRLHDIGGALAARDEIGRLVAASNRLLSLRADLHEAQASRLAAEAANRAKSEFVSRISHELRTPLNAILGFAQSLEQGGAVADPLQRRNLQRISQAGWHLAHLINDLLDLSRLEAGTMRLTPGRVDLARCIEEAVAIVSPDAQAAGIRIEVAPGPAWAAYADPQRLRQVLVNLLSNAVKYNRPPGRVGVSVAAVGDHAIDIAVADTGIGIAADQQLHLFEPFNRLGRERSGQPGTGIGLVITKGLVEMMDGALQVASESGRGSTFTVRLPRAEAGRAPAPPLVAASTPQGERRLLYIEDDEVNVEVLRALLSRRPNFRLEVASTLAQGLQALRRQRPDLLLLDMHLPDGTGLDLLRALQGDPQLASIPVAALSADLADDTVTAVLQHGAVAFIAKPIDFQATLPQLDRLLGF